MEVGRAQISLDAYCAWRSDSFDDVAYGCLRVIHRSNVHSLNYQISSAHQPTEIPHLLNRCKGQTHGTQCSPSVHQSLSWKDSRMKSAQHLRE
jgi:hypothetical protein